MKNTSKFDNLSLKIFGKQKKIIEDKIHSVENGLPHAEIANNQINMRFEEKTNILDQMNKYKVPGISIAVISNFEIEWAKSYGIKDIRNKEKVNLDTVFEAGSISKSLTAAAVLHFIEKKILTLDENINNILQTWKLPENEFTKESKVTLKHLLTHTSGVNLPDSMFSYDDKFIPTIEQVLNGEPPALNDPVEVLFSPGTKHQYSNHGFIIIQKILEDISGKEFPKIMKEIIFEPLKMNNSTFYYPSEGMKKTMASPHDLNGEAKETGLHHTALAQGGLLSTPTDLAKFMLELMKAYQGKSNRILSSALVKNMLTPIVTLNPVQFFGLTGQGFGIFLIEKEKTLNFINTGQNLPGMNSVIKGNPLNGHGVAIMSNGRRGDILNLEVNISIDKLYQGFF
ncbi:MAG: serine hydrolase domain-containing protein [Candidatus Thorarchaeota archaeon]